MTITTASDPRRLDDATLLRQLRALVVQSNETEADMLEHIAEVGERRLYLPDHTSMFAFCTAELRFSEAAAENRITVARASRRFPRLIATRRSLAPDRYHVQLTASRELRDKIEAADEEPHLDHGADAGRRETTPALSVFCTVV